MSTDIKIENIAKLKKKMIAIGDAVRGFTGYGGSLELDDIITELTTVATYPLEDLEKPSCEMNRDEKLTLMADIIRYHRDLAKKLSLDDMAVEIKGFSFGVARIGTQYYETFDDAFASARAGDTITLLQDVDVGTGRFTVNKSITIDGGTAKRKITSTDTGVLFTVKNGALFRLSNIEISYGNKVVEVPASQTGYITVENATIISNQLVYFGNGTNGSLSIKNVDAATAATAIAAYYDARVNMCVENSTITTATYHCIIVDTIKEKREIEIKNSTLIARAGQAVVIQNVTAPVNLNIVGSTITSHSTHALVAKSNTDTVINIENSEISAVSVAVYVTNGTLNIKESTINSTDSFGITVGTVTMRVESSEIKSNTTYAVISTHASSITVDDTKLISYGGYALHTSAKASITLKGYTYLTGVESESRDILYSGSNLVFASDYMGYGFLVKSNSGYSYDLCETLDAAISESTEYGTPIYAITTAARTSAEQAGYVSVLDSATGYYIVTKKGAEAGHRAWTNADVNVQVSITDTNPNDWNSRTLVTNVTTTIADSHLVASNDLSYLYSWNTGATSKDLYIESNDTYTVTVTVMGYLYDAIGCASFISKSVTASITIS